MPIASFSGSAISSTYQRLVQTDGTFFADGTGSLLSIVAASSSVAISASYAGYAVTASHLDTYLSPFPFTGSAEITGSLNIIGPFTASSSLITGNVVVLGTASINTLVVNQTQLSTGSNQLGDAADDTQTLYGTVRIPTGSLSVNGQTNITGSLIISGGIAQVGDLFLNQIPGGGNNYTLYWDPDNARVSVGPLPTLQSVTNAGNSTSNIILIPSLTSSQDIQVNGITIGKGSGNQLQNTVIGLEALSSNLTGTSLTAVGYQAGKNNTAQGNDFFGVQAGLFNTSGFGNVFLGASAGYFEIISNYNTYVGNAAGGGLSDGTSTGGNNVAIGRLAGNGSTGGDNVFLGHSAGRNSTVSNRLIIGNRNRTSLIEGNFSTGNIMIGSSTDLGYKLQVSGSGNFTNNLTVTGSLRVTGSVLLSGSALVNYLTSTGGISIDQGSDLRSTDTVVGWRIRDPFGNAYLYNNSGPFLFHATQFAIRNNSTAVTHFTANSTGVTIGTASPATKLYIQGGGQNWNETTPGLGIGTIHLNPDTTADNFGNAITFGYQSGTQAQAGIYVRSSGGYGTKMYFATTNAFVDGSKTRMFIGHDGNIGMGTTTPQEKLDVTGRLRLNSGNYGWIYGFDVNHSIIIRGNRDGVATDYTNHYQYGGTLASGRGHLFWTGGLLASQTLKLQIADDGVYMSGNVGIGTNSPSHKLEVVGDSFIQQQIRSTNSAAGLKFVPSSGNNYELQATTTSEFLLYDRTVNAYRLFVNGSGNIGIGTITPGSRLQIKGAGTTTSTNALGVENSSGTNLLTITDGQVSTFGRKSTYTFGPAALYVGNGPFNFETSIVLDAYSGDNSNYKTIIYAGYSYVNPFRITSNNRDIIYAFEGGAGVEVPQVLTQGVRTWQSLEVLGAYHHIHSPFGSWPSGIKLTNPATNTGSTDGVYMGLWTSGIDARLWNYETTGRWDIGVGNVIQASINTSSFAISSSLVGEVLTLPTSSGTASMDCSQGNFFTLTLSGSYTLHLSASNIQPGQTINLRITQPATSGSLSYGLAFKFAGGIPYSASATGSAVDIISFISFDSSTLYGSAIKNLS